MDDGRFDEFKFCPLITFINMLATLFLFLRFLPITLNRPEMRPMRFARIAILQQQLDPAKTDG